MWDPETELLNPKISATALEQSSLNLWLEYLGGYFTGTNHLLDGQNVLFPFVKEYSTQQGALSQPLDGSAISITWLKASKPRRYRAGNTRRAFLKTSWTIYLRAGGKNSGDGGPTVTIKKIGDCLHALLLNKVATAPLARKGIHHIDIGNPTVVQGTDIAMRKIVISAELHYPVETYA